MQLVERLDEVRANMQKLREDISIIDRSHYDNPQALSNEPGYRPLRLNVKATKEAIARYNSRVAYTAELLADCMEGKRPMYHLQEAMTTSDFPILYGDVQQRQILGSYREWPITYPQYFGIMEVNDFRAHNFYQFDGDNGILERVAERSPYPEVSFTESEKSLQVYKYGKRFGISFEMVVNDNQNIWSSRPRLMGRGARRSEEYLAAQTIADAAGPHASFFTSGHANIITSNPVLSITALQTALTQLASKKDADGNPILIEFVTLVVPPALEIVAQNILNAIEITINAASGGGASDAVLRTVNWMKNKVKLVVNPYIPIITTTGTVGNTSWYLIASPDSGPQPAFIFAFMRGRRTPQSFVKDPNARSLGGGAISPLEGDFDSDSIDYKLRHIFGAAHGDYNMAMASKGTGS